MFGDVDLTDTLSCFSDASDECPSEDADMIPVIQSILTGICNEGKI